MISLSATAIFWFIALGLLVGLLYGLIVKREGVTVPANIFWGVIASVLTGSLGILLDFGDGLLFAFVYTIAFLFIVNVFHQHHEEDKYGNIKPRIKVE
ncbi:hypothetical protein SAMN05443144_10432 [Fodinibius roseus]|uniref:Uncharacterized protein n=1 Tax=Fodinibius roseus TaxID=1194090 RepID=A0A1M4X628_9BACT|nr:hypothetical protein [Fodinibius roseus]SHE88911.1 hypothetical protein SAMN05443144_10432 [Fodinibius roseus]